MRAERVTDPVDAVGESPVWRPAEEARGEYTRVVEDEAVAGVEV